MVYNIKKIIISQLSTIYSIIIILFLLGEINCSSLNSTEIEEFNKTMHKYNQMVANYNVFSKKMEKITLNIFMRIRFKDLERSFEELRKEIDNLKLNYHKNQSISENIIKANNLTDNFEINYIDSVNAYKRFEETKKILGGMVKTFIIVLSICVFIILLFIGIGSYFVIRYNKKYTKLQEEVSIRIEQTDVKERNTKKEENKDEFMVKSTQEDIQSPKNAIKDKVAFETINPPLSKECLSNQNI